MDRDFKACRILIVDDEESLRLTFEMLLARAGYTAVEGVSSCGEALSRISLHAYDLVISDIILDGASGIDFLRQIRSLGHQCPVVMITGYPNIESAAEAVRLGAFDYLPKPVKKDALHDVVERALVRRQQDLDKKSREEDLARRNREQKILWQSIPELIMTVDASCRVVEMNDVAVDWTRRCLPAMTIGICLGDLAGDAGAELAALCAEVLHGGRPVRERFIPAHDTHRQHAGLSASAALLSFAENDSARTVVVTAREVLRPLAGKAMCFHGLVGNSPVMQRLYGLIANVAKVDAAVLITGESGTGKELVAEALHRESERSGKPLIEVDCAAIPDNLLESELFGHRRGAFTGATSDRPGRILQADGGTLFLDEIGDISPRMQQRLLHFLQDQVFYQVGRDKPIRADVRIIAATNADLKKRVAQDTFREDLYFRLRVVDIMLPTLRERQGDVELLAEYFLAREVDRLGKNLSGFSDQVMDCFLHYHWPGNVRELLHVVERAAVLCPGGMITSDLLPAEFLRPAAKIPPHAADIDLEQVSEEKKILLALEAAGGNKAKAARMLGMDRSTLYRKLDGFGLTV